jgi:NADPH:quinone reductase-like Zn-dependent oxidoreductase
MKVVRYYPPGGPSGLKHQEEPIPGPLKQDQILIKVSAVGVIWPELHWPIYNGSDGQYINHIPGHDFSGTVAAIGPDVAEKSEIRPGSEVVAFTSKREYEGGMAEYALSDLSQTVLKPKGLNFVEAASVPLSALTAWQAFFDHADDPKPGQKLLVTGAAGATGLWGVQVGKLLGLHVTGTASSERSFKLLRDLGVDEIIDYKKTDLEDAIRDVDLVFDTVGGKVLHQCFKVIKKEGKVISIVDYDAQEQGKKLGLNAEFFIVGMNVDQLEKINGHLESGKFRAVIDSVFLLEEAEKAFEHGMKGHCQGKVVLEVGRQ